MSSFFSLNLVKIDPSHLELMDNPYRMPPQVIQTSTHEERLDVDELVESL